MTHRHRARERHAEQKGRNVGLIKPVQMSFRSAADDWEGWLEREYEKALDWLDLARRLNAQGVGPCAWPSECIDALLWIIRYEPDLMLVGLRPGPPLDIDV